MGERVRARTIVVSRFALDGGAMHGVVPRTLWEPHHPVDAAHRMPLVARALVVDDEASGARVLVEAGLGQAWPPKERARYAIAEGPELPDALRGAGVDPDTVTHVVLTHLHWDHAGGVLLVSGDLALPRAEHVVGEAHHARARTTDERDAGSFRAADLDALSRARVRLVRPGDVIAPGVRAEVSSGHTPGLLVVHVDERDDGPPLAFPTDLVPTALHARPSWGMAYDLEPLVVAREKRALLSSLEARRGAVVLYHDAEHEALWLAPGQEPRAGSLASP